MQVFGHIFAKFVSFCGKSTMSMFLATIIGGTIFSLASFLSPEAAGFPQLRRVNHVSITYQLRINYV